MNSGNDTIIQPAVQATEGGEFQPLNIGWRLLAGMCFVLANAACLIAAGELLNAPSGLERIARQLEYVGIGILLGTLFGQAICLGLWSSWGRGNVLIRLLLLLAAELVIAVATIIVVGRMQGPDSGILILISCLLLLFVIPAAGLVRYFFGLQIVDRLVEMPDRGKKLQFGIIHIMGITVAISVLLATTQLLAKYFEFSTLTNTWRELLIFIFLAAAAVLVSIPIFLACLADRNILWMFPMAIVSTLVIAAVEQPVYAHLPLNSGQGGPDVYHFLAINWFTVFDVFVFSMGMRRLGYRITIGR